VSDVFTRRAQAQVSKTFSADQGRGALPILICFDQKRKQLLTFSGGNEMHYLGKR
jgi:hypothetical protein